MTSDVSMTRFSEWEHLRKGTGPVCRQRAAPGAGEKRRRVSDGASPVAL